MLPPKLGIATDCILYVPESESEKDIEEARKRTFADDINHHRLNWWMEPIMKGTAHPRLESILYEGDMEIINQPLDFLGWNCYQANNYNDLPDGSMEKNLPGIQRTNMGWPIVPDSLYWGIKFICERYEIPIMISENGIAIVDLVYDDGCVHDPQRVQYLKWYLRGVSRAVDEGYPVIGYMVWSIMDNFEWAFGYEKRFGLIYVDYITQKRILKDSALWYSELIKNNGSNIQ